MESKSEEERPEPQDTECGRIWEKSEVIKRTTM